MTLILAPPGDPIFWQIAVEALHAYPFRAVPYGEFAVASELRTLRRLVVALFGWLP